MQINYARYPDGGCNDGPGAVQNPAYRASENRPSGGFFSGTTSHNLALGRVKGQLNLFPLCKFILGQHLERLARRYRRTYCV